MSSAISIPNKINWTTIVNTPEMTTSKTISSEISSLANMPFMQALEKGKKIAAKIETFKNASPSKQLQKAAQVNQEGLNKSTKADFYRNVRSHLAQTLETELSKAEKQCMQKHVAWLASHATSTQETIISEYTKIAQEIANPIEETTQERIDFFADRIAAFKSLEKAGLTNTKNSQHFIVSELAKQLESLVLENECRKFFKNQDVRITQGAAIKERRFNSAEEVIAMEETDSEKVSAEIHQEISDVLKGADAIEDSKASLATTLKDLGNEDPELFSHARATTLHLLRSDLETYPVCLGQKDEF